MLLCLPAIILFFTYQFMGLSLGYIYVCSTPCSAFLPNPFQREFSFS